MDRMAEEGPASFGSKLEFGRAVRHFVDAAAARRARRMTWIDADFSDWPLDDPDLLEALVAWFHLPQRQLVLVAADWSRVAREHPRFTRWRAPWSHAVDFRVAPEEERATLGSVGYDDGPTSFEVLDRTRWLGRSSREAVDAHRLRESFDALVQRSSPDFASTTLGL